MERKGVGCAEQGELERNTPIPGKLLSKRHLERQERDALAEHWSWAASPSWSLKISALSEALTVSRYKYQIQRRCSISAPGIDVIQRKTEVKEDHRGLQGGREMQNQN